MNHCLETKEALRHKKWIRVLYVEWSESSQSGGQDFRVLGYNSQSKFKRKGLSSIQGETIPENNTQILDLWDIIPSLEEWLEKILPHLSHPPSKIDGKEIHLT